MATTLNVTTDAALFATYADIGKRFVRGNARVPVGPAMPTPSQLRAALGALTIDKPLDPTSGIGVATDREGRIIGWDASRTAMRTPAWAGLLVDLLQGHIIVDHPPTVDDPDATIYRRDEDPAGEGSILPTWHVVSDVQNEFGIRTADRMRGMERFVAAVAGQSAVHMVHGLRVRHRDGWSLWRREADGVHEYSSATAPDTLAESPAEVDVSTGETEYSLDELIDQARRVVEWMTHDADSAFNLSRMFASPLLDPIGIISYIMYGAGRNGKSLLLKALSQHVDTAREADLKILIGGGYDAGDQILALHGALWALMDEAPSIDYDRETVLKLMGSHSVVRGRVIGQSAVSYRSRATLVYGTNEPPIDSTNASYSRRYAVIQMQDGREDGEFDDLVTWLQSGPGIAALMAFSARHWGGIEGSVDPSTVPPTGLVGPGGGATHKLVTITDANGASDPEAELAAIIVDAIRATSRDAAGFSGYIRARDAREAASRLVVPSRIDDLRRRALHTVGCTTRSRRIDGVVARCIVRADDPASVARWDAWTRRMEEEASEAPEIVTAPASASAAAVPAPPMPITTPDVKAPDEAGFHARFVPGGRDKAVIGWQKHAAYDSAEAALDAAQTSGGTVYAVNPCEGYCIVDCDLDKAGKTDGWTTLCTILGGTPATYMTRTPSGGVHAYYKLPAGFEPKNTAGVGGSALDVRTHKGYVIGPISQTAAGPYVVADDQPVSEMPDALVQWLRENGAEEGAPAPRKPRAPRPAQARHAGPLAALESIFAPSSGGRPSGPVSTWRVPAPDVTPGSTHDDLRDWIFTWIGYAAEADATTDETDTVVRQLLALADPYAVKPSDVRDTELLIRGALDRFGIDSTEI